MRKFGALGRVLYGLRPGLQRGLCDGLVPAVFKACGMTDVWLWQGRILVFSAKGGKLNLVCEKEVKGAAYTVPSLPGKMHAIDSLQFPTIA